METATQKPSPLEQLQGHFKQLSRRQIKCALVEEDLYSDPLTAEDFLMVQEAEKLTPQKKIRQLAILIVSKVKTEDGRPAFSSPKGPKAAAEELATGIPPMAFFDLFGAIFNEATSNEVESLGND